MVRYKDMNTHRSFKQRWLNGRFHAICGALVIGSCGVMPMMMVAPVAAQTRATSYDIDGNYRTARKMYEQGDLDGAEKIFKEILRIQPSHTASRSYLFQIKEKRANVPKVTLAHHLALVKIKQVKLENFTFNDAVKFMRVKVPEVLGENGKKDVNVNFVVFNKDGLADKEIPTDLELNNIPVSELIRYLCDLGGFTASYRGDMVEFRPKSE